MLWLILSSVMMGIGALGVYIFYWGRGQFDDMEEAKYQMFRDEQK